MCVNDIKHVEEDEVSDNGSECGAECECCNEEYPDERIVGCCEGCEHGIENMCNKCGVWDESEQCWYCHDCAKKHGLVDNEEEWEDKCCKCGCEVGFECEDKPDYSGCGCENLTCDNCYFGEKGDEQEGEYRCYKCREKDEKKSDNDE